MKPSAAPAPLPTAVLILAAGAGRRMGDRAKCLLQIQGQSLLQRLVQSVQGVAGLQAMPLLVLGHHAEEIRTHLASWPAQWVPREVFNPAPGDDPSSSLHRGLAALDDRVQAVMVLLADQPLIGASDIGAVLDAFRRRPPGCRLVQPMVNGVPGHPVVFDLSVRADLLADPAKGLRQWRAEHPDAAWLWKVDNAHHTTDLDTPEELAALARDTGWVMHWPAPAQGRA